MQSEVKKIATTYTSATCIEPIENYLINIELSTNKNEASKVRFRAVRYLFIDSELKQRGFFLPLMKCLALEDVNYILKLINEGICGNHLGDGVRAYKLIK